MENSNFNEYCLDFLITNKGNKNFTIEFEKLSLELNGKIKELGTLEGDKGNIYNKFIAEKKKYLVKQGIVLFLFCGVC